MMNLQAIEGEKIETIPVQSEDGISAIVFGFTGGSMVYCSGSVLSFSDCTLVVLCLNPDPVIC